MKVKEIEAVKQTKELGGLGGTGAFGGDGSDRSRRMVTYKYSTCPDKSYRNSKGIGRARVRIRSGKGKLENRCGEKREWEMWTEQTPLKRGG
jgi:hypothetical protein